MVNNANGVLCWFCKMSRVRSLSDTGAEGGGTGGADVTDQSEAKHRRRLWQLQQAAALQQPLLQGVGDAASEGDVDPDHSVDLDELLEAADENKEGLSFVMALFTSLNYCIGFGIICYGFNLQRAGWSGLVAVFICFIICWITALMIGDLMDRFPGIHSYADIGNQAAGRFFPNSERLANMCAQGLRIFQMLELFSYLLLHVVTIQQALLQIPGIENSMSFFITWALIGSTSILLDPLHLSLFSLGGIASFFILYILLVVNSAQEVVRTHENKLNDLKFWPDRMMDFCAAFGGILVLFAGHAVFPSIHENVRYKKDYARVVNWTFIIMLILLMLVGLLMVAGFGHGVSELPTGNLIPGTVMNLIAQISIIAKCVCAFPVIRFPLVVEVTGLVKQMTDDEFEVGGRAHRGHTVLQDHHELSLSVPMSYSPYLALTGKSYAGTEDSNNGKQTPVFTCLEFNIGLAILLAALAVSAMLTSLAFIMSFVGSTFAVSLAITLPGACFAILVKDDVISRNLAWPIFWFGLTSMVVSFLAVISGDASG